MSLSVYKITEWVGWANLPVIAAIVTGLLGAPLGMPYSSAVSMALLQLLVSAALIYTSRQKQLGTDIGHKSYPATLVAYVLWVLMVLHWFGNH
jgi:hypothetical protein